MASPKNPKKDFTATEVTVVLEAIHKGVKTIGEGHSGLDKRLENIEIEVHGNSRRLDMIEMSSGAIINKITRLEDAVSKLSKDQKETREELKETRGELKNGFQDLNTRLTAVETSR